MKTEPRTLDFRATYWGHNISLKQSGMRKFTGAVWSTPRPRVGDKMLWRTGFGHVVAVVKKVDYCQDPNDMCFITCKVVERIVE